MSVWERVDRTLGKDGQKTGLDIMCTITDKRYARLQRHEWNRICVGVGPKHAKLGTNDIPLGWYGICCKERDKVTLYAGTTDKPQKTVKLKRNLLKDDLLYIMVHTQLSQPQVECFWNKTKLGVLDIQGQHLDDLVPLFSARCDLQLKVYDIFETTINRSDTYHEMLQDSTSDSDDDHFAPSERLQGLAAPIYNANRQSQQQNKNHSIMATKCDLSTANSCEPNDLMSLSLRLS